MQPDDRSQLAESWQQPEPQAPQAPYVSPVAPTPTSEQSPSNTASSQPAAAPIPQNTTQPTQAAFTSETSAVSPVTPQPEPASQTSAEPQASTDQSTQPPIDDTAVRWQAAEYIQRDKNGGWYLGFGAVVVLLVVAAIFLMHAWTFAILVLVMAAALIVYTRRPPRVLNYILSRQGLHVNDHLYPFGDFKGFAVIHGDDEYSIMLIPVKRFRPGVSIYFPEASGEAIVDMLAARLPMQEAHLDMVDQIIRKLRI